MSYREAFTHPRVLRTGVRFGASGAPRRHRVAIRATGAREIRVNQVNNGNAFLKGALGPSIVVRTLRRQRGQRADSPAILRVRVFWRAGGDEWFDVLASGDRSITLIPSPGAAASETASNAPAFTPTPPPDQGLPPGYGPPPGTDQGAYAPAFEDPQTETAPTPWGPIIAGAAVALPLGFLGLRALRGRS